MAAEKTSSCGLDRTATEVYRAATRGRRVVVAPYDLACALFAVTAADPGCELAADSGSAKLRLYPGFERAVYLCDESAPRADKSTGPPPNARASRAAIATRLWLSGKGYWLGIIRRRGGWDGDLTARRSFHGGRFVVTDDMLGQDIACPQCGDPVKINDFVCDWSDRAWRAFRRE